MKTRIRRSKFYLALLPTIALTPLVGAAQEDGLTIEEIVVTAQKRKESLQQVPLAVTAILGDTLREDGVSNLFDLSNNTPGLIFAPYSNAQPEIAIRGIGTKEDGPAANDSTVILVDDVYIAARSAQIFDLFDLERVEVLRGPQGTLYGKNSIGGSINFVTTDPTPSLTGRFSTSFGEYGQRDFGGLLSGPLSDNFLTKISFSKRDSDGFFRNVLTGKDEGGIDTIAIRSKSIWTPSDDVSITFIADWAEDDNGNPSRQALGLDSVTTNNNAELVSRAFGNPGDDPHISTSDEPGYFDRTIKGLSAKVEIELDDMTLTSVTSWRESEFDWLFDLNGVPGSSGASLPSDGFNGDAENMVAEDTRQVTQEFRLSSSGNANPYWVVGGFFSKEKISRDEKICFTNCGIDVQFTVPNFPQKPGNIINGSIQTNDATAWAVYGQTVWDINDKWSLTTGLRYSTEEKDVDIAGRRDLGLFNFGIVVAPGIGDNLLPSPPSWAVSDKDDWTNVSGRLALDYQLTDSAMLYGSIASGFKSGGYTGTASTPERALSPFDEEKAINYELGLKSQWLDYTLQLNVSAFYTDYTDLQVTRFFRPVNNPANTIGEFTTENAAEADIYGIEFEWLWLISANLEFGGNYAYLDAEYDNFTPPSQNIGIDSNSDGFADSCGTNSTVGTVANGQQGCIPNFSGNKLRQAPRNSGSAYLKYTLKTDSGTWSAKTSYRYQGFMYFDPDNNDLAVVPNYSVVNARLGWTSVDEALEISIQGKNLTDKDYRKQVYSTGGGTRAFYNPGDPRTYSVTVAYSFD